MAKKPSKPKSAVIERAKKLKKIGVLGDLKLNRKLTNNDKRRINNTYTKLRDIAEHPKDYIKLKATRAQVRAAKATTYKAFGDQIFVKQYIKDAAHRRHKRFDQVKVVDNRIITYRTEHLAGGKKGRTKQVTYIDKTFSLANMENSIKKRFGDTMPPGTYVMVRVGDDSPFGASLSLKDLYQASGVEKVLSMAREGKIAHVSIVIQGPAN